MAYEIAYNGNLPWLKARTILFVVAGSRAYGTSRPDSDYDYRGIAVPPRPYFDGFLQHFNQAEFKHLNDATIYDIRKFFALAADCNPNILELLWTDPEDRLICTPQGQLLVDNRELFMSKKALYTFRGYAVAQLKRIKTHRRWLLEPAEQQPTRKEFDLPERTLIPADQLAAAMADIQKQIDSWEIDFGDLDEAGKIYIQEQMARQLAELAIGTNEKFQAAARLIGYDENFIALLDRERHYTVALRNYQQYQEWKKNRNPVRAALEAKYQFDCKFGMHIVRLLKMCREILAEGVVRVRRPDAEELKAIREGAWTYDQMVTWVDQQDAELIEVAKTSPLPKAPDRNKLDDLCQEIVRSMDTRGNP